MDNKGFSSSEVSEQNKEALQSETWKEVRKAIKTEIIHFTDTSEIFDFEAVKMRKNDNVYGIGWGRIVRDYLKTAYAGEDEQAEVVLDGVTYKVLKRGEVTSFYDADGNTLFDVEAKRLEREYGRLMDSGAGDVAVKQEEIAHETAVAIATAKSKENDVKDGRLAKQQAEEKLKKEMEEAKEKSFAEPIIGYLLERCKEDEGLAEDVMQEHKTWQKCFDHIFRQARQQAHGNCVAVRDEVVYEWAEDYYHKDDKAEEEEKARKEAEKKDKQKKAAGKPAKTKKKPAKMVPVPEKKEEVPKEQPTPKKSNRDMEGQLDMFSMMGM